jgi:large subunit ribosomal protein L25
MADISQLAAEVRERAGKGAARATRRAGRVPAVIYGNKQDPVMISLDPRELNIELRHTGFFSRVYEVDIAGTKHRVLPRDLQVHPITDHPLHLDFMRFSAKTRLNVDVEVVFLNEEASPGLKEGGVLNIVRHAVELRCRPDDIPESLTVDLTGLEIGDSVHISAVTLPEDVELTITDRDFTIATIAAPTVYVEAVDEEGEEGEAGEVMGAEDRDEESAEDGDGGEDKD